MFRISKRSVVVVVTVALVQLSALVGFLLALIRFVDAVRPFGIGAVADQDVATMRTMGMWLAVCAVVIGISQAVIFAQAEIAGFGTVAKVRMAMYQHLLTMQPSQIQHRARGGLLLRFVGDLGMLRQWISRGILLGSVALATILVGVAILAWLDPLVGLVVTATLLCAAGASLAVGPRIRALTRAVRRHRSTLTGNIEEQINAGQVVQSFGRQSGEYARLARQNEVMTEALNRVATYRGILKGIAQAGALLSTTAAVTVGAHAVWVGRMTLGEFVACVIISRMLARPVRMVGVAHDSYHRAHVSRDKIMDFLTSSGRNESGEALENLRCRRGQIAFNEVSLAHRLHPTSCVFPARSIVALTGPAGAGKSSVLALAGAMEDPTTGAISIDDQDVRSVRRASLSRHVGWNAPDLPLMRGTIGRNLNYSNPHCGPAEHQRATRWTGVDTLLQKFPDGLQTWLVEGGRNISAGQRQLITVARAFMGNPTIMLLDNPTIHLDADQSRSVVDLIARHHGTVIVATADPAVLAVADYVWRMADGHIVEQLTGLEYANRQFQHRNATSAAPGADQRTAAAQINSPGSLPLAGGLV